jgi:hypothetical protein
MPAYLSTTVLCPTPISQEQHFCRLRPWLQTGTGQRIVVLGAGRKRTCTRGFHSDDAHAHAHAQALAWEAAEDEDGN